MIVSNFRVEKKWLQSIWPNLTIILIEYQVAYISIYAVNVILLKGC